MALETPATIIDCLPGPKAGDSEETLKVLAKDKCKCCNIIIPFGINNTWLHQLDVIKINVASVCNFA